MSDYVDYEHAWQVMGSWIIDHQEDDPLPEPYVEKRKSSVGMVEQRTLFVVYAPLLREDGQVIPNWNLCEESRIIEFPVYVLQWGDSS